jgi:hypothetical protein
MQRCLCSSHGFGWDCKLFQATSLAFYIYNMSSNIENFAQKTEFTLTAVFKEPDHGECHANLSTSLPAYRWPPESLSNYHHEVNVTAEYTQAVIPLRNVVYSLHFGSTYYMHVTRKWQRTWPSILAYDSTVKEITNSRRREPVVAEKTIEIRLID